MKSKLTFFSVIFSISGLIFSCQKTTLNAKTSLTQPQTNLCISAGENCFYFDNTPSYELTFKPFSNKSFKLLDNKFDQSKFTNLSLKINH